MYTDGAAPQPFFLPVEGSGQRFCLYHAAAAPCRGALLLVPPFGDEMNKSRRMLALLARALARQGVATLQIDLYGCGDSSGDSGDARWSLWLDDLHHASAWLQARSGHAPALLGLRLGALLALEFAATAPVTRVLLWQPVLDGATFLTQLLRLRMAGAMLEHPDAPRENTAGLRRRLLDGEAMEIGGYLIAPEFAQALETRRLGNWGRADCPLHWFDVGQPGRAWPPAALAVQDAWRMRDIAVDAHLVDGPQFWGTQEITTSAALIGASAALAPLFAMEAADAL
ncbi:hydrolase 2, exosortase A system-associated [Duganella sp. P38]|uniref:hydrolase 2, exosortase A system-associated n=1 Tax=Duganella sp. P38 TaxID=3423949 RepID=UPI003D7A25A8